MPDPVFASAIREEVKDYIGKWIIRALVLNFIGVIGAVAVLYRQMDAEKTRAIQSLRVELAEARTSITTELKRDIDERLTIRELISLRDGVLKEITRATVQLESIEETRQRLAKSASDSEREITENGLRIRKAVEKTDEMIQQLQTASSSDIARNLLELAKLQKEGGGLILGRLEAIEKGHFKERRINLTKLEKLLSVIDWRSACPLAVNQTDDYLSINDNVYVQGKGLFLRTLFADSEPTKGYAVKSSSGLFSDTDADWNARKPQE